MVLDELLSKYSAHKSHANQVMALSLKLFDDLKSIGLHNMTVKKRELLTIGACLHDIGYFVDSKGHNKHSAELIKKEESLDFNEKDKKLIACIARYHRGVLPNVRHDDFCDLSDKRKDKVQKLAGIVRLADGLDRMHLELVRDVKLKYCPAQNILWVKVIPDKSGVYLDLSFAQRKKDLLEKAFGVQAVVVCA